MNDFVASDCYPSVYMQLWEFSTEAEAIAKMNELTGSDSTDRKYRVDEI